MRSFPLVVLLLVSACGLFAETEPATNSTGHLNATGEVAWSSPIKGLGLARNPGKGSVCVAYLFDVVSTHGGDQLPNDANATYSLNLSVGQQGKLAGFITGDFDQIDAGTGMVPMVSGSLGNYGGFKHTFHRVFPTAGTVSVTRFDADRLVGTFKVSGDVYCSDKPPNNSCHLEASGDFDVKNVDCMPPIAP
jgi:hypothetical protein